MTSLSGQRINNTSIKKVYKVNPNYIFWYLALSGVIIGIVLSELGMKILGPSISIIFILPLILYTDQRLFPGLLFGPLTFTYVFHSFGYALGPIWQYYVLGHLEPVEEGFVPAQWGGVVGLLSLVVFFPFFFNLGSKLFKPASVKSESQHQEIDRWYGYGLLMLFFAILVITLGFSTGVINRLGGSSFSLRIASLVNSFSSFGIVMFFFLGYTAVKKGKLWWLIWLTTLTIYSLFYFLDGSRGPAAYAFISSAVGIVWGGFSRKKIIIMGLVLLTLFIPFTGVVLEYRNTYYDLADPLSLDQRVGGFYSTIDKFNQAQVGTIERGTEAFISAMTADSVDRVFLLTPKIIPFVGFEGINRIIYVFIPEVILPNRPVLVDGNELAIKYDAAPEGSTGSYMPAVGDGYRRGGWLGIFLLYAFSSLVYGMSFSLCWDRKDRREWAALFVFLLMQSPGIWSTTLLTNFYFGLWVIPRNWIVFWILRRLQDFIFVIFKNHSRKNHYFGESLK